MNATNITLDKILKRWSIVLKEPPIRITGGKRIDLADLFKELDYKIGAEIGVERGLFSEEICKRNPGVELHCVDAWAKYPGYRKHLPQSDVDELYQDAKKRLEPYGCKLIREFSVDAAKQFQPKSLDFVYIDGNHRYECVVSDIATWIPKIRSGGIIAGHDYMRFINKNKQYYSHVIDAVCGWTHSYFVNPWFTLQGENARTWFWVV